MVTIVFNISYYSICIVYSKLSVFGVAYAGHCVKQIYSTCSLSTRGRVVITTIYQPQFAMYDMFDSLTLLSRGSVVYHGPAGDVAISYFSENGKCICVCVYVCTHARVCVSTHLCTHLYVQQESISTYTQLHMQLWCTYLLGYEFPKYSNPAGVMLNAIFLTESDIKANTSMQALLSVGKCNTVLMHLT